MAERQRAVWYRLILALICLTSCLSRSSTVAGHTEYDRRRHVFIISEDTDRTNLVYMNTGAESEPEVVTFENPLPSPSLCGADYERCNAIITSNTDESIRVVMFPLISGIALVSFDNTIPNDTLVFREKYLLPENQPNCTYIYFVDELIGYCLQLDPATIRAFQIRINFTDLTASTIHRRDDTVEAEPLMNINSLSNLLYFVRHESDGCFSNEGSHVVFLDQGDLLDHRFTDGDIMFSHNILTDSTCLKLLRVGDTCELAASCDGKVVLFDTRQHVEPVPFMEAEYGQIFFCPSGDFVRFEHGMLSLYNKNRQQFGSRVSFPLGEILQGHCLHMADKFFFVVTVEDGRTVLVNFSDASYQQLGDSDLSTIPLKVRGHIAIINNGSATHVYNLDLTCLPEPLILPNNFVLATFYSTRTLDPCQCLDPAVTTTVSSSEPSVSTISPTPSSLHPELASGDSSFISPLPTTLDPQLYEMSSAVSISSTPLPEPTNLPGSSPLSRAVTAGIVVAVLVVVLLIVIILLAVRYSVWWWRKRRKNQKICANSTLNNQSNVLTEDVKLQDFNTDDLKDREDIGGQTNYELQPSHECEVPSEPNDGSRLYVGLLEREESSHSQQTQVQAKELTLEGVSISSGSADTSAASPGPHTHTLVLKNPVRQEVGDGTTTNEQSDPKLDASEDAVVFQPPESHQDGIKEASSATNGVQSPTDSEGDCIRPTAAMDMTFDTSQLCMENQPPLNFRASHLLSSSPVSVHAADRVYQPDVTPPAAVQHVDRSNGYMVSCQHSSAASLRPLPDNVKVKFQQTADKMNTLPLRQLTVEVAGGTLWNTDPDAQQSIDRYM